MRRCHCWRETWVSECHPSLVLSCQPWYRQCVNQRSLRLRLGATATGRDDTGGNAPPCWECRKFGGLLSIHQTRKMNGKKLRAHVYTHRKVCFCVKRRRTRNESEREEESGHVLTFDWQSTWENHETFRWMPWNKKGLDSRNGGRSNSEVLFSAATPFIDTHDSLNSSPVSKQPPAIVCLVAVWLLAASSIFAVMSKLQKTHEVLITASLWRKQREWKGGGDVMEEEQRKKGNGESKMGKFDKCSRCQLVLSSYQG